MTPLRPSLTTVAGGGTLTRTDAAEAMAVMMRGAALPEEMAALLVGMAARGETIDELTGFAETMRAFATPVRVDDPDAIDVCGTGGDLSGTFNVSTATAFVVAGAGVTVAKHGNRSVSSLTGSADVLEALGVAVNLGAAEVEACVAKTGIGFLFAPLFHPALHPVMPVRRTLGVRTAFNVLGPLCNPAGVRRQVVGCFSAPTAEKVAGILAALGATRAVALSSDGLDEATLAGPTLVCPVEDGAVQTATSLTPDDVGLARAPIEAIRGGTAVDNARMLRDVLDGVPGPPLDAVLLNSALALRVAGRYESLDDALAAARESVASGAARARLAALADVSSSLAA